jgi:hypothetical protein
VSRNKRGYRFYVERDDGFIESGWDNREDAKDHIISGHLDPRQHRVVAELDPNPTCRKCMELDNPINDPEYQFYVLDEENVIWAGNEYREDAEEALDNLPPGDYRVVAKRTLKKIGIDPDDDRSWDP